MRNAPRLAASLALPLLAAACSTQQPTMMQQADTTYYKDVKPIVDAKCTMCHRDGGIAPFALASYEDVQSHAGLIKMKTADRTMPPWLAAKGCADYVGDRSLADDQIATIGKWVDEGAAEGNAADYRALSVPPAPSLSRVDAHLGMAAPYTPVLKPDEYRCFLIDWPSQTTKYVSGFRANPGNAKIVHHVIAFLALPNDVASFQQLDAADPAPGYTCFGGPGNNNAAWLGAWAPGSMGSDFPTGTGLKVPPGSKVVLQVHYNLSNDDSNPDQTTVDFKLDDQVDKVAVIQPWTNIDWVRNHTMLIPAGDADKMYDYAFDPSPYWSLITNGTLPDNRPMTFWNASLHMHTHGTRARLDIEHADGTKECMLDIEAWNFHWQGSYGFAQPKTFKPGDQIYLQCHWDNSPANQPLVNNMPVPPKDLNWGEGTGDEMCLGGFYITAQ